MYEIRIDIATATLHSQATTTPTQNSTLQQSTRNIIYLYTNPSQTNSGNLFYNLNRHYIPPILPNWKISLAPPAPRGVNVAAEGLTTLFIPPMTPGAVLSPGRVGVKSGIKGEESDGETRLE